jgi:hypothetical protein
MSEDADRVGSCSVNVRITHVLVLRILRIAKVVRMVCMEDYALVSICREYSVRSKQ